MAKNKGNSDFAERTIELIKVAVQDTLNVLGREGTEFAKKVLEDHRDLRRTEDSITYALKSYISKSVQQTGSENPGNPNLGLVGSAARQEDVIRPVEEQFLCKIGTAKKGAKSIEFGSGAHRSKEGHEEFVKNITEWGFRHGFDEDEIKDLIKRIQLFGTEEIPFMRPTLAFINSRKNDVWVSAWKRHLGGMSKVTRTITSKGVTFETSGPGR